MYQYIWDNETGGLLLTSDQTKFSKEPRPVYYKELDILGFDKFWNYPKDDSFPLLWAESNNYFYKGKLVAKTKGGSLYHKPELILLEKPEPNGNPLQFVDINLMCKKNQALLEALEQDTIKKIYNTYREYKNKVDIFYVAFSGGKDSVVTLDLVQRALPHNDFVVIFGDTGMEFPDTIALSNQAQQFCINENIKFHIAKAPIEAQKTWQLFGPPARKVRWCCNVHKTAPVINKLYEIYNYHEMKTMMITGVRGAESLARSDYDEISFGKKLAGQYSYHPILNWTSSEIFLYIYTKNLLFNNAYKLGFNRVGCIVCPNSSSRHEFFKNSFFPETMAKYNDIIVNTSSKDLSGTNKNSFLENGCWKTRLSGRELNFNQLEKFSFEEKNNNLIFKIYKLKNEWKTWYKTIGKIDDNHPSYLLEFNDVWRKAYIIEEDNFSYLTIENEKKTKNSIEFVYLLKCLFAKSQYCINCLVCVAECPSKCITMNNKLSISDNCTKCHSCLKILSGCLYYNSIKGSTQMKSLKGINRYLSVGVDYNWIKRFLFEENFEPGNRKTDVMFSFLTDANILSKRNYTFFGNFVLQKGIEREDIWALIICNLAYSPAFKWYLKNIPFNKDYTEENLYIDMEETTKKAQSEFWNGFKIILDTNFWFKQIGIGQPNIEIKKLKNGLSQKKMHSFMRTAWTNPVPEVILYSLYKFAEACDNYYQFSLETLLDDSIEREGVSPTRIFGLDKDTMIRILNGLSINYPDFISASFTLDLDNISLRDDKSSENVLSLL